MKQEYTQLISKPHLIIHCDYSDMQLLIVRNWAKILVYFKNSRKYVIYIEKRDILPRAKEKQSQN